MVYELYLTLASSLFVTVASTQDAQPPPGGWPEGGGGSYSHFPKYYHKVVIAHAVLASVSWVIFFPLGAVIMRLLSTPNTIWIHAATQVFSTAIFTAAVGTGVWMSLITHQLDGYHPIIGLVIFAAIWFNISGALVHHYVLFPKYKTRTGLAVIHTWLGRILITLGMINGGLGLKLSGDASKGEYIAYGVISAVIWLVYVCLITFFDIKVPGKSPESRDEQERTQAADDWEKMQANDGSEKTPAFDDWEKTQVIGDSEFRPTSRAPYESPRRSYTIRYTARASTPVYKL